MKKKALSLMLTLVMCLSAPALAAEGDFTIKTIDNEQVLTSYNGSKHFGRNSVVIPGDVTFIGRGSFNGHISLTDVTIPNSVTGIGPEAFWGCANLKNLTLPDSLVEIYSRAFLLCKSLTDVTIPKGVTRIDYGAFAGCDSLTAIQVAAENQNYISVDGVLFTRSMDTLVAYPAGKEGAYDIPDTVTSISDNAFSGKCENLSLTVPNSVTSISDGFGAFSGCKGLKSITIPESISSIGRNAFKDCISLTSITIPHSVTEIEWEAFCNCDSLTSIDIPDNVTRIGLAAFRGCDNLTSITLSSSLTNIPYAAFDQCKSLKDVYFTGTEAQWEAISIEANNDFLTSAMIHFNTQTLEQPVTSMANPTNDKLTSDGVLQNPTVYKIGDSNYFKIRDLAAILNGTEKQFSVGYDNEKQSVTATTGQGYTKLDGDLAGPPAGQETAEASSDAIYVNGQKVEAEVYKIGGNNYFKLRDLGKALDFYVGWSKDEGMYIDSGRSYDTD